MSEDTAAKLSALKSHLSNTQIKLYTPDTSPDYKEVEGCWIARPIQTLAIARPRSAEDVSTLIRYCTANDVAFSVRAGGHDCAGRTRIQGALLIDMRGFDSVVVAEDQKTAHLGGGVLLGKVQKTLADQGLVTPGGTISSVGYIGWSTLGGYGPLSSCYGLGVDQIIGARIVDAQGQIMDANDEVLAGIRGGGGTLGIIFELTIKVYPLEKLLTSTIVYDSSDIEATISSYATFYENLMTTENVPTALQLQPVTAQLPEIGMSFAILVSWASPDEKEGRRWIKKVAGAGPCIMELTKWTTMPEFMAANDNLISWPSYGRVCTVSTKRWTSAAAKVLAKYSPLAPGGGLAVSVHSLRPRPEHQDGDGSVFGARTSHHVWEIIGLTGDPAIQEEREKWASQLKEELVREDPENIYESTYIALGTDEDTDLLKVYGKNYDRLVDLKRKYDAGNVFKYAVPRLFPINGAAS